MIIDLFKNCKRENAKSKNNNMHFNAVLLKKYLTSFRNMLQTVILPSVVCDSNPLSMIIVIISPLIWNVDLAAQLKIIN